MNLFYLSEYPENNLVFVYRDALKRNYNLSNYWVEINIEDLSSFDEVLAEKLYKKPTEHLPILEEAAKEVGATLLCIVTIFSITSSPHLSYSIH